MSGFTALRGRFGLEALVSGFFFEGEQGGCLKLFDWVDLTFLLDIGDVGHFGELVD